LGLSGKTEEEDGENYVMGLTIIFSSYYLGDEIQEDEVGGAHCTYGFGGEA
jgi:hypothetical protein